MKVWSMIGGPALAVWMVAAASAAAVTDKIEVRTAADKAWAAIGAFCDIKNWLPPIASCEIGKKGGSTSGRS